VGSEISVLHPYQPSTVLEGLTMRNQQAPEEPPIDLQEMFQSAEVYVLAGRTVYKTQKFAFSMPKCVLESLGLEIFLKCLILIEGGHYGNTHDLYRLFLAVSLKNQTKIRNSFSKTVPTGGIMYVKPGSGNQPSPRIDFDYVLRRSAKAFEAWRYVYEASQKENQAWLASGIVDCVRDVIVELKPSWGNFKYGEVIQ
jgi:hypothetical protein